MTDLHNIHARLCLCRQAIEDVSRSMPNPVYFVLKAQLVVLSSLCEELRLAADAHEERDERLHRELLRLVANSQEMVE